MPNRRQAIIWTNVDPIHWPIYAVLGWDELTTTMRQCTRPIGHFLKPFSGPLVNICNNLCLWEVRVPESTDPLEECVRNPIVYDSLWIRTFCSAIRCFITCGYYSEQAKYWSPFLFVKLECMIWAYVKTSATSSNCVGVFFSSIIISL